MPLSENELLDILKDVIDFSTKTGHPMFLNQLSAGLDPYGLAGVWVSDALNVNVFTYECAPVFTVMEKMILREVNQLFGFPATSEGIFCPGGSLANGFAMNLARFHKFPEVKKSGSHKLGQLVAFVSEEAHYSSYKMAGLIGIGEDHMIPVQTDSQGKMRVDHLLQLVQKYASTAGYHPFMVIATAGTTVLGAFDPLVEISGICEDFGLWLHVDAAWGGSVIFSTRHKYRLNGIEKADSFLWNPHKGLATPQQCSILCVKHAGLLRQAHTFGASYLFQKDKCYDTEYDLGDMYLQCGRKPDVFKLWFMWKAKGYLGFERHVDTLLARANYLTTRIRQSEKFQLVCDANFINVSFWYLPERLRGKSVVDHASELHKIAPKIKKRMMRKGNLMINYQPLKDLPNFFRFVCCNSSLTDEDCDNILAEIDLLGSDL